MPGRMHLWIPVALLSLFLLAGCVPAPDGDPHITGRVTEVGRAVGSPVVQILVEAKPGIHDGSDKAYVFVLDDRAVLIRRDESHRKGRTSDLTPGVEVEVWFDGPVAESYPVQGRAKTVVIVAR